MMSRRTALRPLFQIGALLGAIMVAAPAQAEVRIAETIDSGNLTIEAHNATVREVLDALAARQSIEFRSSEALSRPITGTYSGTPRRVISRVLEGYDHVVESTGARIRISVFGAVAASPVKAVVSAAPAPAGVPAVPPKVSSNVDLDEEMARAATAPKTATKAAGTAAESVQHAPTALIARVPATARVSTNVDLDEESLR